MTTTPGSSSRVAELGRALRHRNFRLFFAGQTVSLIGTWLTRVASSWLVYRLTGSTVTLGIAGFAGQVPTFVFAPFAGVWVDRWNQHRVLFWTQVLAMLQSAALAALALTGRITVPWLIGLGFFQGLINAFDVPTRQSLVIQMVDDREDLSNAIALNSSMVNVARLLGPSIAGLLIAAVGEGWCFFVDALTYFAVLASIIAMRVSIPERAARRGSLRSDLSEGLAYVGRSKPIRNVLLLLALVSFMGMPYVVLMPAVVKQVLSGGPHTLGFLMAANGVGALAGTLYLAARKTVVGLGRVVPLSAAAFGIGLIAFSMSHDFWLAFVVLIPAGAGQMIQMAGSNTVLQTLVDDDKRGRVMSFFTMAFFGTVPFGSLFGGVVADRIGSQNTILLGGVTCVLGAMVFFRAVPEVERLAHL